MAPSGPASVVKRIRGRLRAPSPTQQREPLLESADPPDRRIVEQAMPYSMTSAARLLAVVDAVRYCAERKAPGAFVECGVWRGGSVLAMVLTLQDLGATDRDIYLYDTFTGMTKPTAADTSSMEPPALETWTEAERKRREPWEAFGPEAFTEEEVRSLLLETGYPPQRLHFVPGAVEKTLPGAAPGAVALLRLDTDWYESTYHELVHLFPKLSSGGVLIVDDYGHWHGARRAVDEYLGDAHPPLLLSRIDYTGRMAVKA